MDRPEHNNVDFFVGTEVEHTPAHGQKTLFVIGLQHKEAILTQALNHGCPHIYLGADHSFSPKNHQQWQQWSDLVTELLDDGIWVTLDYDVSYSDQIIEHGYNKHNNFIAMISVKIPNIQQYNYNACVKIDDSDFKYSNPGVWVHSMHDLQTRDSFTDWSKYNSDTVIDRDT